MGVTTRFPRAAAGALALLAGLFLTGCSTADTNADIVGGMLPELGRLGLERIECADGAALGEVFIAPESPYVAECWQGARESAFTITAHEVHDAVLAATQGIDVTDMACPKDVFNATAGIACRATYVGEEGNNVLVRVIVVLADPSGVVATMPASPGPEDIENALTGAQIEVLVGTEPVR